MICTHCKKESDSRTHVCPYCGEFMGQEGVEGKKKASDISSRSAPKEKLQKAVIPPKKSIRKRRSAKREQKRNRLLYKRHRVNWAWVLFVIGILVFGGLAGSYAYLKLTPGGQVVLARMGKDCTSDALWTVGNEYMDKGYITKSIEIYEKALEQEPERKDILSKLKNLAEAYEAAGLTENAKQTYQTIYKNVKGDTQEDKNLRIAAYRSHIRILTAQEYLGEAVELMKEAFDKTGDVRFFKERSQLAPLPPSASLAGGSYVYSREVEFISEEGYDIFYTTGETEELPEEGILYTTPIKLDEGVHVFRAVCATEDLVSDEMNVKYTIRLPVPMAPRANMEPSEYNKPFRVKLRNVGDDPDVTMYYTVDGTKPTLESPLYTEEGILITPGRITLRAIAVNKYGKVSNELNQQYKVKGGFKNFFNEKDKFGAFALMQTTYDQFSAIYGKPTSESVEKDPLIVGNCTIAKYPWGEARFCMMDHGNLLYYIDTNETSMAAPRGTKIGSALDAVISQYRDMGQVPNAHGDRGFYYEQARGYGAFVADRENPSNGVLEYCYIENAAKNHGTYILTYHIQGSQVGRIVASYSDKIIPNVR